MVVRKEIEIDYAHCLPDHYSFCNQLHGHRAKISATVKGNIVDKVGDSSHGMVLDFIDLKSILMEEIHKRLDHGFAVWKDDTNGVLVEAFVPSKEANPSGAPMKVRISTLDFVRARNQKYVVLDMPPTAEVLTKWAFGVVYKALMLKHPESSFYLEQISWNETPTSQATYTFDDYQANR